MGRNREFFLLLTQPVNIIKPHSIIECNVSSLTRLIQNSVK